ncbi:tyrosine-type recombinase/integrase [Bacillus sp. ISL-7]|uniref:tyrosine-type recombinase/integrase n=1 Tax=Bacillus sp. ISL-7 TaxID=2819136 RepID=UPI001BE7210C|nr:tyrosine-type recombinase/integrase [Bacillus sp. ISL-7]MBT2738089.1 tyrosine-type recombinase/integrase [Bacillus sp. ISL-7]
MPQDKVIYTSCLSDLLNGFVKEQRAVGYKYIKGASLLKQLDNFLEQGHVTEKRLTKEMVLTWTKKRPNETESTRNGRISIARGFAKYMVRLGYEAFIYPAAAVSITRYSYIPYIFSEEEMRKIFIACDNFPVSGVSPNRNIVLQLLIRMLYGCGLRISEALRLKIDDVDLESRTLFIREAKLGKERLVPMSETLAKQCRQYQNAVHKYETSNVHFFPSPFGGHYNESTIYKLFRELLWKAGIPHNGKGPRLHDLRHTFSVHCLKRWVLKGEDLTNLLPYLSTYLGHTDLRGTQHYLRLTADLYPTITASIDEHFSTVIPEVYFHEAD